jgi:hypothetical protein
MTLQENSNLLAAKSPLKVAKLSENWNLLTTYWRLKSVTKWLAGKFTDGLNRQKQNDGIYWRPQPPQCTNCPFICTGHQTATKFNILLFFFYDFFYLMFFLKMICFYTTIFFNFCLRFQQRIILSIFLYHIYFFNHHEIQ